MEQNLYSPHQRVLGEQKKLRFTDLLTLFFSFGIGLSVMQTGTVLAIGGGSLSYLSIIVGVLFGTSLLAIVGSIGSHTGLSSMASLRLSFGHYGIVLPTILNILQLIGWGSFGIIIVRDSLLFILKSYLGHSSMWLWPPLWSFVIGGMATVLAISGPLSVVRLFLKKFAIWLVLGSSVWITCHLFSIWDSPRILHTPPSTLHWGAGIDIVASLALSYLPIIGDYTRFASFKRSSFLGVLIGFSLGNMWLMSLGASYTLLTPENADVHVLLSNLSMIGAGIPLLLLVINETDNLFPDIHSSSVSIALFFRRLSIRWLCFFVGLLCIGISILVDLSSYVDFILAISSLFAPLFGIVLADFVTKQWVLEKEFPRSLRVGAVATWVLGVLVFQFFKNLPIGGAIPALLLTLIFRIFWNTLEKKLA